ncbi:MAG TPA: hypothetical protein VGG48_19090 [Rhizomicrobium sp.]|jgi:hypothetical protein
MGIPLPSLSFGSSSSATNPGGAQSNTFNAAPSAMNEIVLLAGLALIAVLVLRHAV